MPRIKSLVLSSNKIWGFTVCRIYKVSVSTKGIPLWNFSFYKTKINIENYYIIILIVRILKITSAGVNFFLAIPSWTESQVRPATIHTSRPYISATPNLVQYFFILSWLLSNMLIHNLAYVCLKQSDRVWNRYYLLKNRS